VTIVAEREPSNASLARFTLSVSQIMGSARDRYVAEFLPLVEGIARRIRRKLPKHFELEDLVHEGVIGLMHAARTYRADAGASPKTWASRKINYSIRSAIRGHSYGARIDLYHGQREGLDELLDERNGHVAPAESDSAEYPPHFAQALAQLSPERRMLIEMLYEQNQSLYALRKSRALGLSKRGLRAAHDEALEQLRPLLRRAA
jgi:RNA polymerase sigma factor (sigma-70 family)